MFWLVLLGFSVLLVFAINQAIKNKKQTNSQLSEAQKPLTEKEKEQEKNPKDEK